MSGYSQIRYCLQEKSTHFGLKVSVVYVISSLYVLNCFKCFLIYILGQNVLKNQRRKILNYIKSLCAELFQIFSNIYNGTNVPKKSDKKNNFETYQVFTYNFLCQNDWTFAMIFELYKSLCVKMTKYSQTLFNYIKSLCGKMIQHSQMVYTLKALLSKNRFYFFFFQIFSHAKIPPFFRIPRYKH